MSKSSFIITFLVVCAVLGIQTLRINQFEARQTELEEDFISAIKSTKAEHVSLYTNIKKQLTERVDVIADNVNLNREKIEYIKDLSRIEQVIVAEVTAYTATIGECNEDPGNTAAMLKPRLGMIAVSRDLFYSGWVFGKKVYIEKLGIFIVGDLMNQRWEQRIDVLMPTKEDANQFGKKKLKVALLDL